MKTNYNNKRSNTISSLKRKNNKLVKQINEESNIRNIEETAALKQFEKRLRQCSNITLYAEEGKIINHIASHTCNHKACFVCNFLRQKKIRRKYLQWFNENTMFCRVLLEKDKTKLVTKFQYEKNYSDKLIVSKVPFDIMHLTLTVPHTIDGFRGQIFYQQELRKAFNLMRKTKPWLEWVYGGEFGIEITKGKSGLHIHIHSLIFVRRAPKNRNKVHKMILLEWNKYTIDHDNKRTPFNQNEIEGIMKGNSLLKDSDIKKLNPKGATMINVRTINGSDYGQGKRTDKSGMDNLIKGVLEAISYHFEPQAFDKENGSFDIPLLIELMPKLYNLRIYDRFGILYNESPLSMTNNAHQDDLEEIKQLNIEELNNGINRKEFFITNPAYVFHDTENNNNIILSNIAKDKRIDLSAGTTNQALGEMSDLAKAMHKDNFQYT